MVLALMSASGPVFLFGVNSMLGWSISAQSESAELLRFCNVHTRVPRGAGWRRLNLQDASGVAELFAREQPSLIIHCAGICDVEKCEGSPEFAHLVNVSGMEILLDHVPATTRIVYLSSDHVFSGERGPYTESSPPDPISVYGHTRVAAEALLRERHERMLIIRAGLWIGRSYNGRIGHLDWLHYRRRRGLPMTVVADEYRSAVWAEDAARRVLELASSDVVGIRHVVASRIVSRPELAAYLDDRFAIGARFEQISRCERGAPHLGRVDLRTEHTDLLAAPLPPVVPESLRACVARDRC